jgi:hypothetical protein
MTEYFEVITDAKTGEVTTRPYTPEEITAVQAWVPPVPEVITPRQARLMLLQMGMLSQVEAMIAQQDEATKIAWEYSTEFKRNHPLLLALAGNLGMDPAALDDFFRGASAL